MREGSWSVTLPIHIEADAAATWSNMPAADTFLFGSHRHVQLVDCEGLLKVRLKVNKQATAGAAGAKLMVRFAHAFSTSVGSYEDIGVTEVSVAIDTTNDVLESDWVDIHNDARKDHIFIAIVGSGGNGTIDPQFGSIIVSFQ